MWYVAPVGHSQTSTGFCSLSVFCIRSRWELMEGANDRTPSRHEKMCREAALDPSFDAASASSLVRPYQLIFFFSVISRTSRPPFCSDSQPGGSVVPNVKTKVNHFLLGQGRDIWAGDVFFMALARGNSFGPICRVLNIVCPECY